MSEIDLADTLAEHWSAEAGYCECGAKVVTTTDQQIHMAQMIRKWAMTAKRLERVAQSSTPIPLHRLPLSTQLDVLEMAQTMIQALWEADDESAAQPAAKGTVTEPTRMGAYVEDDHERVWLRADDDSLPWRCVETGGWDTWDGIPISSEEQVLFPGIEGRAK